MQTLYKQFLDTDRSSATIAADLIIKLKDSNKLIRIADSSAAGWATVRSGDIGDNDDEKIIRQAESRALRSIKDKTITRPMPYTRTSTPARSETAPNHPAFAPLYQRNQSSFRQSLARREPCACDVCHLCKQFGHWRKNCPLNVKYRPVNPQPNATKKQ